MNNNSKLDLSKIKTVLAVAAITTLLMMAINLNANWNANATTHSMNFNNKPDVGRSVECVKVVLGCNGQGSVGSSKDVNIESGENNTSDNSQLMGPIDLKVCEECFAKLSNDQKEALFSALDVSSNADACSAIEKLTGDDFMELLLDIGVDVFVAIGILDCLGDVNIDF